MTEIPPQPQQPLETKVATEVKKVERPKLPPITLTDILGGLAKGLLPLAAGTAGGYWATRGPGGVGCSLLLTSLGMSMFDDQDTHSNRIADYCYRSGLVIGVVLALGAGYVYHQRQQAGGQ